jgi:response regulator RpfG family c-di-GMP phosphodiesterase
VGPAQDPLTVLFVDDEPAVLSALTRLLRPDGVRVLTAGDGVEALDILDSHAATVGVVMSDYSMPGMNGAELLRSVRERWPDITRVLLTGNADLTAASRAVNEGQLSRLFMKPWQPDQIRQAVTQALDEYRMLAENRRLRTLADAQAERLEHLNQHLERLVIERTSELEHANLQLHRSLLEIVRLLLTSLEHRLPRRAAHCKEVARLAGKLAERAGMGIEAARRVQVAALVHDVGLTALPDAIVRRSPAELSMAARAQYQGHPAVGQRMLSSVAELTDIATWIRHHHERWDGRGYPDRLAGDAIPLAARIIALADGYLEAVGADSGTARRWRDAQKFAGAFDPELLQVLDDELDGRSAHQNALPNERAQSAAGIYDEVQTTTVAVETLRTGMVLVDEVRTTSGKVLLRAGERLTADRLQRIQEFYREGVLLTQKVAVAAGTVVTESAPPII